MSSQKNTQENADKLAVEVCGNSNIFLVHEPCNHINDTG